IVPRGKTARPGQPIEEPGSALRTLARAYKRIACESVGRAGQIEQDPTRCYRESRKWVHGERRIVGEAPCGGKGIAGAQGKRKIIRDWARLKSRYGRNEAQQQGCFSDHVSSR